MNETIEAQARPHFVASAIICGSVPCVRIASSAMCSCSCMYVRGQNVHIHLQHFLLHARPHTKQAHETMYYTHFIDARNWTILRFNNSVIIVSTCILIRITTNNDENGNDCLYVKPFY